MTRALSTPRSPIRSASSPSARGRSSSTRSSGGRAAGARDQACRRPRPQPWTVRADRLIELPDRSDHLRVAGGPGWLCRGMAVHPSEISGKSDRFIDRALSGPAAFGAARLSVLAEVGRDGARGSTCWRGRADLPRIGCLVRLGQFVWAGPPMTAVEAGDLNRAGRLWNRWTR